MSTLSDTKILIGRSNQGNQLQIAVFKHGKRVYKTLGVPYVPDSVSRLNLDENTAHCSIEIDRNGQMTINNLKYANVTVVDGMPITSRLLLPQSSVMLGGEYYPLYLQPLFKEAEILAAKIDATMQGRGTDGNKPEPVNIWHLERVWNEFEYDKEQIMKRKKRLGILASITPIFTIGGAAVAGFANHIIGKEATASMWVFSGIALIFFIVVVVMRVTDNSDKALKEAQEKFLRNYHCPKCKHFMGNMPYFLLRNQKKCHGCGSPLIT